MESRVVTTFTFCPLKLKEGRHVQVTISTELPVREGVLALLERLLTSMMLRRIYTRELKLLAAVAQKRYPTGSAKVPTPA